MESFDSAVSVRDEMAVVEKVARAIHEAGHDDDNWWWCEKPFLYLGEVMTPEVMNKRWLDMARAAIKAYAEAIRGSGHQPNAKCDHKHWSFAKHGRVCTCGVFMADFGD